MKKLLFQIICILFLANISSATVLHYSDSSDTVLLKEISINQNLHDKDSLMNFFRNHSYLDISVTATGDSLHIATGVPYLLQTIHIHSDSPQEILVQKRFTQSIVTSQIENIISQEIDSGYQFATIIIDSTIVENSEIELYTTLQKGPHLFLDKLKFEGLTKTRSDILQKYFKYSDTIITSDFLTQVEKQAGTIPFVRYQPPIKQEINPGYTSASIIIPFAERENILFEGGGGYLSESDLFLWNMSLQFQNIFGAGQQISVIFQKKDSNHQHLKLQYSQPIFVFGVGSASIILQTRDYRDRFYEFMLNPSVQTKFNNNSTIGFSSIYKSVEQEDNALSYRSVQLSFSIHNMNAISVINNRQKFSYESKFSYGNRKYKRDSSIILTQQNSFNESRIEIRIGLYTKLKRELYGSLSMKFKSLQTDENIPPYAELYLVGGNNSIRGFKDEQFPSIRNITFTAEPQYVFSSGNIFLFYDGGFIYNRVASEISETDEHTIYRYGYGAGIALVQNSNSLKISFGWNKNLKFDNPRISLLLKTQL